MPQAMEIHLVLLFLFTGLVAAINHDIELPGVRRKGPNRLSNVHIECNSNNIMVTLHTQNGFDGMIYPRGLSSNSSCMSEYERARDKISYKLPLRSCNTMSHEIDEGIEFYNRIVIQPHHKLVTSLGKGMNVRCRYEKFRNATYDANVIGVNSLGSLPAHVPLPNCVMKIFLGRLDNHVVAETVKIGDFLTLHISIDEQDVYGMYVTNCIVKDGLNLSEHPLINTQGCPIDKDILGSFEYSKDMTSARVVFPAHKFPFTSSVYYQCNVKLCTKKDGGCEDLPPICDSTGNNILRRRRKRETQQGSLSDLKRRDEDEKHRSIEVFSGLYVNEVDELEETEISQFVTTRATDEFCVSTKKFAIGIGIAGILLTLAVILLVICIVNRRRRKKIASPSNSSIYSGPYSNHAYSRD